MLNHCKRISMDEPSKLSNGDDKKPPLDAINQLTNALVRIFDDKGQVAGTGFLVDDKDILTSARVLAQAIGRNENFPTTQKTLRNIIRVDFPLIQPRQMFIARNNRLIPRRPEGGGDFATLRLENLPSNAKPIGLLNEKDLSRTIWGHRFWAMVTSEGKDAGDWIFGTLLEKQENDWIQIKVNHIDSFEPKFDGTPIWDEQMNRFVGMGIELGSESNGWIGFIIPSDYLISQFGFLYSYAINLIDPINKKTENNIQEPEISKLELENMLRPIGNTELCGASNDLAADKDQLGFKNYAKAFAKLIESQYTQPPITIGIYGSWGMGKSTILKYIEDELKGRVRIIKFNAWEYSAAESIWPGLVRKIMDQIEQECPWNINFKLLYSKCKRNPKRMIKPYGKWLPIIVVIIFASILLIKHKFSLDLITSTIFGLSASAILGILYTVYMIIISQSSQWTSVLLENNKYGKNVGYMEEIHEDLDFLQKYLVKSNKKDSIITKLLKYFIEIHADLGFVDDLHFQNKSSMDERIKERIFVVIDDLDRCEPDKAVEVLQAVNLLLNFESFVVCLGIDARIITRAIEEHYKNLLGNAEVSGYEYLEKIVQIPFKIPEPSKEDIAYFMDRQLAEPDQKKDSQVTTWNDVAGLRWGDLKSVTWRDLKSGTWGALEHSSHDDINKLMPKSSESLSAFEESEKQAFKKFIPFIRPNPRHIKRFINIYRLVRILAEQKQETIVRKDPSTVIRWLLICGQWPCSTCKMLEIFDKIIEEEKNEESRLIGGDILVHIYKKTNFENSRENMNSKLDYDLDSLNRIINCGEGLLNASDLMTLRRYTVNINPAVEAEFELKGS